MTKDNKKTRAWTLIVYPDSAPKNWRDAIDDEHIGWIESPLHDKDVNPDGTIKKAHWHILLLFDGPTTFANAEKIGKKINAPVPQSVASARGMVRYMIHMDNPEKYQYPREGIVGHGGADVESFFELTATTKMAVLKEIVAYIFENNITSFADLTRHAIEVSDDWFDVITNRNTLFLNKLIDSIWQKSNQSK